VENETGKTLTEIHDQFERNNYGKCLMY